MDKIKNKIKVDYVMFIMIILISLLLKSIYIATSCTLETLYWTGVDKIIIEITSNIGKYLYPLLILIGFTIFLNKKVGCKFLIISNIFLTVILFIDAVYYRAFQFFPSVLDIYSLNTAGNVGESISTFIKGKDIILFLDIPLTIYIYIINISKDKTIKTKNNNILKTIGLILIIFSILSTKFKIVDKNLHKVESDYQIISIFNISPFNYHIFDIAGAINSKFQKLSQEELENITTWFQEKEKLPSNKYEGLLKDDNVIFIHLESFEGFLLGETVEGEEITPFLNNMMKNSLNFTNIYEQTKAGISSDAEFLVNTSFYPINIGSVYSIYKTNKYITTLGNIFTPKNYTVGSFLSSEPGLWSEAANYKNFNFNKIKSIKDLKFEEEAGFFSGLSDEEYFNNINSFITEEKNPFIYYTYTTSNHHPFNINSKYHYMNLPDKFNNTYTGRYLQTVRYTDKQLENFLSELENDGLLDNTTIVLFGDHEGINKFCRNEFKEEGLYKEEWLNNNKKVPFIIYNKKINGENIETIGGQVDILPTVLYLLGEFNDEVNNTTLGRNLLNTERNFVLLSNGQIIGEDYKEYEDWIMEGGNISEIMIKTDYFNNYYNK